MTEKEVKKSTKIATMIFYVLVVLVLGFIVFSGKMTKPIVSPRPEVENKDHSFGIYLVTSKVKSYEVELASFSLADEPMISDKDIVEYDWKTHRIDLVPGIKLPEPRSEFIVVADGERCYLGAFWSQYWSIACSVPNIEYEQAGDYIEIEAAHPGAPFRKDIDPRGDKRILKCLKALGKIKEK